MPSWTNLTSGDWTNAARWTGGIPNAAGAVAEFTAGSAGSGTAFVQFNQNDSITVGTLNIVTDADDGYLFRGNTGVTSATLRFQGVGGSPAFINVDTNGSTRTTTISSQDGLIVNFVSDVILTTANSDTFFEVNAPISGPGDLFKFGAGTLALTGNNSAWNGDLNLFGGRTEIFNAISVANAVIEFNNSAVLVGTGNFTLANRIEVGSGNAVGTIAAETGRTLTVSGLIVQASDALTGMRFGSASDTGTIILTGTSIVLGNGGFTVAGGTVRVGNAGVATNYFSNFSADGLLQIAGTLDTNGFAMIVDNLDLDNGTVRANTGVLNLTVNDNYFAANSQDGSIVGTAGADRLVINAAIDWAFSGTVFSSWTNGVDTIAINGSAAVNNLIGSSQSDIINGGAGADAMSGGGGSDIYFVDNAGDVVVEGGSQGTDMVYTSVSYALGAGQSIEVLDVTDRGGTAALGLTGNGLAQTIVGNEGANVLNGAGGADIYYGLGGNDAYFVWGSGDVVIEYAGQGSDTVFALASYALTAGQEIEMLDVFDRGATSSLNLTGNNLAQTIVGNAGANVLNGGSGGDIFYGLGGSDSYVVWDTNDLVIEAAGQGNDTVFALASYALATDQSIEVLDVFDRGATTALNLTGNNLAQTIIGNAGANVLNGGDGGDILYGLGGTDTFAFTTAPGAGNIDTLADFSVADDTVALDDAIFTAIGPLGALNANAFVMGTQAADASDRIIYNATTGQLLYDADGVGGIAAIQFATLNTGLAITAADFAVI